MFAALADHQLGDKISLGGAFALLHYLDYRSTYDVDAWWQVEATTQEMTALIQRGAPRNFRDIYAVCEAALTTPAHCWQLWQQRQALTHDDTDVARAKLAIAGHLERIEQYRPLDHIGNREDRAQAEVVRKWYKEEFLHATVA